MTDGPAPDDRRQEILTAAAKVLVASGARGLNVRAVMAEAAISRTAFYRQFDDIYGVVEALIEHVAAQREPRDVPWLRGSDAVGSPEVVYDNLVHTARTIQPWAPLLKALHDATGLDPRLRAIWRDRFLQPRIDLVAASIRRDQRAGAIRQELDPDTTALALSLTSEAVMLELLQAGEWDVDQYARIAAPIWTAALFGRPSAAQSS